MCSRKVPWPITALGAESMLRQWAQFCSNLRWHLLRYHKAVPVSYNEDNMKQAKTKQRIECIRAPELATALQSVLQADEAATCTLGY
jgi:hypothetical protein